MMTAVRIIPESFASGHELSHAICRHTGEKMSVHSSLFTLIRISVTGEFNFVIAPNSTGEPLCLQLPRDDAGHGHCIPHLAAAHSSTDTLVNALFDALMRCAVALWALVPFDSTWAMLGLEWLADGAIEYATELPFSRMMVRPRSQQACNLLRRCSAELVSFLMCRAARRRLRPTRSASY